MREKRKNLGNILAGIADFFFEPGGMQHPLYARQRLLII